MDQGSPRPLPADRLPSEVARFFPIGEMAFLSMIKFVPVLNPRDS